MLAQAAILIAGAALGQGVKPAAQPRPVDQGYADRDELSRSLRHVETGLQQDQNFRVLYEVPGRPDLLMRRSGAIIAVFPRSQYVQTREGVLPLIPSGAVFYIGGLPADLGAPGGTLPTGGPHAPAAYSPLRTTGLVTGRIEASVRPAQSLLPAPLALPPSIPQPPAPAAAAPAPSTPPPAPVAKRPAEAAGPPTVFTNEAYRRVRLAQILNAASPAGQAARAEDDDSSSR